MAQDQPGQDGDSDGRQGRTPLLEWISAAVGLLITLAMLSFIGWQAWTGNGSRPPAIEVRAERITPVAGGYAVEVVVRNLSPTTAAAVGIEGELRDGPRVVATSQATLGYVPGHSERQAGLFFEQDPRTRTLDLRPTGYAKP